MKSTSLGRFLSTQWGFATATTMACGVSWWVGLAWRHDQDREAKRQLAIEDEINARVLAELLSSSSQEQQRQHANKGDQRAN